MKKAAILLMTIVLIFSMAACQTTDVGNQPTTTTTAKTTEVTTTTTTTKKKTTTTKKKTTATTKKTTIKPTTTTVKPTTTTAKPTGTTHVHNYENGYCFECKDLDESLFTLDVPDFDQTYEAVTLGEYGELYRKILYKVKDVNWTVSHFGISSYKPYGLYTTITLYIEEGYVFDESAEEWVENKNLNYSFYHDWVHLVYGNGEHQMANNSYSTRDYETYTTIGKVGEEIKIMLRWIYNDPGTYSLEFINGLGKDFWDHETI